MPWWRSGVVKPGRSLSAGDIIYVKDVLRTEPDSAVGIVFDHNGARWQLTAGLEVAVQESAAWRAKRGTSAVFEGDKEVSSGAAGRHTEREGGDTASTGPSTETVEPSAGDSPEVIAAIPEVPDEPTIGAASGSSGSGGGHGADTPTTGRSGSGAGSEATKRPVGGGYGMMGLSDPGPTGTTSSTGGTRIGRVDSGDVLSSGEVARALKSRRNQISACAIRGKKTRAQVKLTISDSGRVQAIVIEAPAEVKACLTEAIKGIRFPKPKSEGSVVVEFPLELRRK